MTDVFFSVYHTPYCSYEEEKLIFTCGTLYDALFFLKDRVNDGSNDHYRVNKHIINLLFNSAPPFVFESWSDETLRDMTSALGRHFDWHRHSTDIEIEE